MRYLSKEVFSFFKGNYLSSTKVQVRKLPFYRYIHRQDKKLSKMTERQFKEVSK